MLQIIFASFDSVMFAMYNQLHMCSVSSISSYLVGTQGYYLRYS